MNYKTEKNGDKEKIDSRVGHRYLKIGGSFYRPWASDSDLGEKYIHCKWCQTDFLAKNTVGKQGHENTLGHKEKTEEYQKNKIKFQTNVEKNRSYLPSLSERTQKIKLFEYKFINLCLGIFFIFLYYLTWFFSKELNLSFRSVEEIAKFLKKECYENPNFSTILQQQTIYRQKATRIAVNVFKQGYMSRLGEILERTPFSITADEVTTKAKAGGDHFLAICVHFPENALMKNKLWRFIELQSDCDSHSLFQIIDEELIQKYGKNLIAFITDGAPVFNGRLNGVKKLVSEKAPSLINVHCLAHATDLVAKKSFNRLNYDIWTFINRITTYFTQSSVHRAEFTKLQLDLDLVPLQILHICKTLWLVLHNYSYH